jgi:hypothetical protein
MVHGWPLLSAALTACNSWGSICHHVEREAGFIPSTRKLEARSNGIKSAAFLRD